MFPGGFLALGGANTPNTFARWSVRLAIGDDVDRFPPVVGDEGDPGELLVNRTTTFHDRLAIFVSTPTLKGGRIDSLWSRSDQRRFHVTCPQCGRVDWITWNDPTHLRVVFDEQDPPTARIACPDEDHGGCGYQVREPARGALVASGEWRPTAEPQEPGLVAFHVPAMLSPWVSLPELVEKFLVARARGRESLKVFINTLLGEAWEDRTQRMEAHRLMAHVEDYGVLADGAPVAVPAPAVALTAGVDVQQDGFLLLVCGWGPASERWVVDWRTVPGDTKRAETRAALLEALGARYAHATGLLLPIHATCIDSGYATETIYDFVLQYQARRIFATKGFAGRSGEPIVGKAAAKTWGRTLRPVRLFPVNVDDAKAAILASLALPIPGPNSTHFPARVETVDAEFFAQLCAEHQETRYAKSGVATHQVWVQDREANHALDAMVLASAAVLLLRPNLRDMAARIAEAAAKPPADQPRTSAPAAPSRPIEPPAGGKNAQRRVRRSSYLERSGSEEW
jgi:phage terminase large subunit GpA-like protein